MKMSYVMSLQFGIYRYYNNIYENELPDGPSVYYIGITITSMEMSYLMSLQSIIKILQ